MTDKELIIDFDSLYDSMQKCRKGVGWKQSVKSYTLNAVERTLQMYDKLHDGTWANGKPIPIVITYPKKRDGLSISFRDRIYQRSANDLVLYPKVTKSFIQDNVACQIGKGADVARKRCKRMLRRHFINHGLTGYVVVIDVTGYYASMRHDVVRECFARRVDPDVLSMCMAVLNEQYIGDVGFNPGSQMVQIAGISCLDKIDHTIKEKLHCRNYARYMDDSYAMFVNYDEAATALETIREEYTKLGFTLHPKKTKIIPLKDGFEWLGFKYILTESGKVRMLIKSQTVKHERKKMRRMAKLVAKGRIAKEKYYECYHDWRDFATKGNTYKLLVRMDKYVDNLLMSALCA